VRKSSVRVIHLICIGLVALFVVPLIAAPGDVKTTLDAPCRYPAGLATDGKSLFVVDWREAVIHEVDPLDGKPRRTLKAPTLKPAGLAYAADKLFVCDDHTGWIFVMGTADGVVHRSFQAPEPVALGLAFHDEKLFILCRERIYTVMPEDGTILASIPAPDRSSTSLAHDGRRLWVSNRNKDELYMVEPEQGQVVGIVKSPGPYPAGIAWLDGYLWNVDFQTRKLYQIVIDSDPPYRLSQPRKARIEFAWILNNYGPADVVDLRINLAIPTGLPSQRLLSEVRFSREPARKVFDRWGQECAVFEMDKLSAGSKAPFGYEVQAEACAISYLIFPERTGRLEDIPADIRDQYTADGSHLLAKSAYIEKTVKKIIGEEKNPYWIARKIYNFVIERLEYEMTGGWDVPEVVLKRGKGSCSEYTYCFITLCRAAGLPARYVGSVVARGDEASVDEAFHRWAEIYLPNYGWVPVDANRGDSPSLIEQARGFGEVDNRFLITTHGGGDSEFLGWSYNAYATFKTTGQAKTEEDNFAVWEPLKEAAGAPGESKPSGGGKDAAQCKPPTG